MFSVILSFSSVKKKTSSIVIVIDVKGYLVNSPFKWLDIFYLFYYYYYYYYVCHNLSEIVPPAVNTFLADLA